MLAQSPQLVAHVPPRWSWPGHGYHLMAARRLARLLYESTGKRARVWVAVQQNVKGKPGEHSHWLVCGPDELREARRTVLWEELRKYVASFPGLEQPGEHRWAKGDGKCSVCRGRHRERAWFGEKPNECRLRIEPVAEDGPRKSSRSIAYYVTRYCLREDVETAFYEVAA